VTNAAAGRVLRLALVGWGFGHLALGRRATGWALLVAEVASLAVVVVTSVLFADTTWYLLPYLAGMAFIVAWAAQAVAAFRAAQRSQGATQTAAVRSPAAAAAWLTLPLLLWGTGFWLIAAGNATPAAVVDRFVSAWSAVDAGDDTGLLSASFADQPELVAAAARASIEALQERCRSGQLSDDCGTSGTALLRDIRFEINSFGDSRAVAIAQLVRYERQAGRFLWLFETTELVPVHIGSVLRLELERVAGPLGAGRWLIMNATDLAAVPMV
jgi:hypothetical protein